MKSLPRVNYCVSYDNFEFAQFTGCEHSGHLGTDVKVHNKTGYEVCVLNQLWGKYKHHLDEFRPTAAKDYTKAYFFLMFVWIHLGPTARNIGSTLHTPQTGFVSEATFRRKIKPMLLNIGSVVDEIHW